MSAPLLALRDRMAAPDPGLARLALATRGTVSVFMTTVAALIAGHFAGVQVAEFAGGVTLSMMAPFLMREPTFRQRLRTLLTLPLPAAAATVATALLHGQGPLGDSCFLGLVFLCFVLHPRSPRMIGMGLVAVVITYVGLFLELPPSTLPLQLASLVGALPIIALACFVIVPMNPVGTLRRTVTAVQWRAARVLRSAGAVPMGPAQLARLRRDLARLNEAALAADDQLALLEPDGRHAVRSGLIHLELATARLIDRLHAPTGAATKPAARQTARLRLHARRMRRGRRYAMRPESLESGTLRASLVELGHAVHALGVAAGTIGPARDLPPAPSLPPGPLGWRLATRVTLAAALAMAAGIALSPQRWFWAVMTVYVVFLNARSRGDTIYRGIQRVGGTLLGMASGLVLATLLARDEGLQAVALLLSIFGMYYFILTSYTGGIFCVTVMLGLLYGMLGAPLETLLLLRLEETAIGAVAAILVAAFVLPTRTRDLVISSGRNVLTALVGALHASGEAIGGPAAGTADPAPMVAMRRVDRQVADLRLALAPLEASRSLLRRSALERPVPALLECVHWTRAVVAASLAMMMPAPGLAAQAAAIEARLSKLAGVPAERPAGDPPAPQEEILPPDAGSLQMRAALARLEQAVATLSERLEIGALEGFAL